MIFSLPDLGEGLKEAEIIEWYVQVGDDVQADAPLLAVETDKAMVDVPSPCTGRVEKLFAEAGDAVEIGEPLVSFEVSGVASSSAIQSDASESSKKPDQGTVVGEVVTGTETVTDKPQAVGSTNTRIKAIPAVRALARKLDVDLNSVSPSGPDGTILRADVERVAKRLKALGPAEALRGARRVMARKMIQSHAEVVPATIVDDADIDHWPAQTDITVRLLKAMTHACRTEPSLNAWFDSHSLSRRVLQQIDIAIALDTPEALYTPVLRDVANRDEEDIRSALERLKQDVNTRAVPPDEMRGYSITLSNFGMIAGRYATPVIVSPTVAILGAGRVDQYPIAVDGVVVVRRQLPLSLTFDHRAVTGGEAGRFLHAVIASLQR